LNETHQKLLSEGGGEKAIKKEQYKWGEFGLSTLLHVVSITIKPFCTINLYQLKNPTWLKLF
jgi:hypothetical protein